MIQVSVSSQHMEGIKWREPRNGSTRKMHGGDGFAIDAPVGSAKAKRDCAASAISNSPKATRRRSNRMNVFESLWTRLRGRMEGNNETDYEERADAASGDIDVDDDGDASAGADATRTIRR